MSLDTQLELSLPTWVGEFVDSDRTYSDDQSKVALAIDLARRNVETGTGGPFGAAIFDAEGRILAVGVNRVLPETCSVAHAETMAFMLAQRRTGRVRLNRYERGETCGPITLAASGQPCCQCYGAAVWAGLDRLLIGARSEDIEELTEFDEGPMPIDWVDELAKRGIAVVRDVLRDDARRVLQSYAAAGGPSY